MALNYQEDGQLTPGIHSLSWDGFITEYGYNDHRKNLISGLEMALSDLKSVGCKTVYIDGSFVTKKEAPGDFDACWVEEGVDLKKLKAEHPLFFDFSSGRAAQKGYYGGEWFPAKLKVKDKPNTFFVDFFQMDKEDNKKGIICLTL